MRNHRTRPPLQISGVDPFLGWTAFPHGQAGNSRACLASSRLKRSNIAPPLGARRRCRTTPRRRAWVVGVIVATGCPRSSRCSCWCSCCRSSSSSRCRSRCRCCSCCCCCWRWRSGSRGSAIHPHGEVRRLALLGGGLPGSAKEVAVEERVHVVATWRPHAVGPAGGRVKRTATEVADRRHIEEVGPWRQTNVQPRNLDHEFGKPEPAPPCRSNYRRHGHAAGNQRPAVAFGDPLPNFPGRAGNVGIRQIVGEDSMSQSIRRRSR